MNGFGTLRLARRSRLLLAACLLLLAPTSAAERVTIPVQLDFAFLRDTLLRQLYTDPGPSARILDDGHDCARLTLTDPRLDALEGRLRLRSLASARLGTWLLGRCNLPVDWSGEISVLLEPRTQKGSASVGFRVADSSVRRADGSPARITGALWDWIKESVHPRLSSFHVDLERPLADLRAFLPLVLPSEDALRTQRLVDSIALAGARVAPTGVVAELRFEAPEAAPLAESAKPTDLPLTEEQITRLDENLQRWDAFLTFVLKHAGRDTPAWETRRELLAILLDARGELVDALAEPATGRDPVRALFLSTWTRLAPLLRRLGGELPGEASLRYLSFITAADALSSLDRIGPSAGLDISVAGLRRLAGMLAPSGAADPLAFDDAVDPELRELFDFGEPIEPPPPDEDAAAQSLRIEWTLVQRTLTTAERARLRGWVPAPAELEQYLPLVHAVLDEAAEQAAAKVRLDARFAPIYGWLVLAAAWKESCWRQFVLRDGKAVTIRSPVGAVGILQVSVRVWRGFYDAGALVRDLPYNAHAGAEILAHYLVDYAIPADEAGSGAGLDALARATYSAYNGGPRSLARWRSPSARPSLRKIDEAFWRDYQAVKANGEPDTATCYGT